MPRRNRREWRMDPREVQLLKELNEPAPSGKSSGRKKPKKGKPTPRFQESQ